MRATTVCMCMACALAVSVVVVALLYVWLSYKPNYYTMSMMMMMRMMIYIVQRATHFAYGFSPRKFRFPIRCTHDDDFGWLCSTSQQTSNNKNNQTYKKNKIIIKATDSGAKSIIQCVFVWSIEVPKRTQIPLLLFFFWCVLCVLR